MHRKRKTTTVKAGTSCALVPQPEGIGSFVLAPLGLTVPGEPTVEQWEAAGKALGRLSGSIGWAIGDWINCSEAKWGAKYDEAAELTGLEVGTLRDYAWVSRQFDLSVRTDKLPWSVYRVVAGLPEPAANKILAQALHQGLSVRNVRELAKVAAGDKPLAPAQTPGTPGGSDETDTDLDDAPEGTPVEQDVAPAAGAGNLVPEAVRPARREAAERYHEERQSRGVRETVTEALSLIRQLGEKAAELLGSDYYGSLYWSLAREAGVPLRTLEVERHEHINDFHLKRVADWPVLSQLEQVFRKLREAIDNPGPAMSYDEV